METRGFERRRHISKRLVIFILACGIIASSFCAFGMQTESVKLAYGQEVFSHAKTVLHKTPLSYLLLFPGILAGIAIVFAKKKKADPVRKAAYFSVVLLLFLLISAADTGTQGDALRDGVREFDAGNFGKARALFEKCKSAFIERPYLRRDIAVCYMAEGNTPGALSELYSGARLWPGEPILFREIAEIEKSEGLANQYSPVPLIDPDIPFIAAMVLFNLSCILLGVHIRTKKSPVFRLMLCSFAIFVTTAGFSGFTMNDAARQFAIVSAADTGMKKIPLPDFGIEKKIQEGTSLRVYGEANGYVLAETGTGLKGWIKKENLLAGKG
jgi:hypothetical protein